MNDKRHPTAKKIDDLLDKINGRIAESSPVPVDRIYFGEREAGGPYRTPSPPAEPECDHGLTFPMTPEGEAAVLTHFLTPAQVREAFPRLDGPCPLGCGYCGIAYVSYTHYLAGDW